MHAYAATMSVSGCSRNQGQQHLQSCICTGATGVADPLEDECEELVWRWELRDAKVLPKAQRQQAQGIKRALLKVVTAAWACTERHALLESHHV